MTCYLQLIIDLKKKIKKIQEKTFESIYCGIIRFHVGSIFVELVGTSHPRFDKLVLLSYISFHACRYTQEKS